MLVSNIRNIKNYLFLHIKYNSENNANSEDKIHDLFLLDADTSNSVKVYMDLGNSSPDVLIKVFENFYKNYILVNENIISKIIIGDTVIYPFT